MSRLFPLRAASQSCLARRQGLRSQKLPAAARILPAAPEQGPARRRGACTRAATFPGHHVLGHAPPSAPTWPPKRSRSPAAWCVAPAAGARAPESEGQTMLVALLCVCQCPGGLGPARAAITQAGTGTVTGPGIQVRVPRARSRPRKWRANSMPFARAKGAMTSGRVSLHCGFSWR